jgi:drug/metabolite transporter (DMT)-like permease
MVYMTFIAGLNFVVLRDAVTSFSPMVFNAMRLGLGAVVLAPFLLRRLPHMRFNRHDLRMLILTTMIVLPFMQFMLVNALHYTSSSNVALMLATGPAWTVMLLARGGAVRLRRSLLLGLGVMVVGTGVVIASRGSGFTFSTNDLIGCGMMLAGSLATAWYTVYTQPLIQRYNVIDLALLKQLLVSVGVMILAAPELLQLHPGDIPTNLLPNIVYAGVIASISGSLTSVFALRKIGPARMKTYDNIIPATTALFAFLFLGEPITLLLLLGGMVTLYGVMVVRRNARPQPAAT